MRRWIRPAMLLFPLAAGVFLPELAFLGRSPYNFIRWALMAMIFFSVLQMDFADLKPCREHFLLLAVNILLGLGPFFILKWLYPDSIVLAQTAFFTGIAPTAAAAAVIVSLLGGRTGFAVTGFVISNVGISLALPGLLPVITGNFSTAFFAQVFSSLVMVVAIPLTAARLTRRFFPGILKYSGRLKEISLILWSCSLLIIAAVARQNFAAGAGSTWKTLASAGVIALILCVINFVSGGLIARKEFRRETSQIMGQKNTTFALYLALEFAGSTVALGPVFYVLFHNLWNSLQLGANRKQPAKVTSEIFLQQEDKKK